MRIVLTRWPHQAGRLEEGLRAAGIDVGFLPLTEQRLPADLTVLRAAVTDLAEGRFQWLLLTSATTVWALQEAGWDGDVPEGTRIGVTGPGTAQALPSAAPQAWMPHREASAAGILAELPAPRPGEQVLLPQSAQARPQLVNGLRSAGWEVTQVTAYETVDRVREGTLPPSGADDRCAGVVGPAELAGAEAVLITSSTAARAWARLTLPGESDTPALLAIGRPTAQTLDELQLSARMLEDVSAAAVLRALGVAPGPEHARPRPVDRRPGTGH
ncbi:uroporphyrinogen-III synthase [Nesterenkonia xinjiangensis]|uniref:Uroporphyrinogen-III synthase n=1 Tax=Nesterenkonia xinjiangensis TaxID=225327 RepID=A0A7Z0GN12_9MICC|nr:uroporphyrinogen-III synthase [Nesterenkonia xinjiangensis]NYJ78912.1 uroporphyrinogen-III synthase [Nesterenkonia xinjiangensis]